jgi:hypothetical protein
MEQYKPDPEYVFTPRGTVVENPVPRLEQAVTYLTEAVELQRREIRRLKDELDQIRTFLARK